MKCHIYIFIIPNCFDLAKKVYESHRNHTVFVSLRANIFFYNDYLFKRIYYFH